jgi:hypothetical protein
LPEGVDKFYGFFWAITKPYLLTQAFRKSIQIVNSTYNPVINSDSSSH